MLARNLLVGALVLGSICAGAVRADVPTDPAARAKIVGTPKALLVHPDKLTLSGPRATAQPVVTGVYADGSVRDLTHVADLRIEGDAIVALDSDCFMTPKKNGASMLTVSAGGQTVKVPVLVKDLDKPSPVSFRNDVIASLNVGGCNSGACHGTPTGKNGFKLSLRGYDPDADHFVFTRQALARRVDRSEPAKSLMLLKGTRTMPHGGGTRIEAGSLQYQVVVDWIAGGPGGPPAHQSSGW